MAKSNRKALKRPDEFVSTGHKIGASLQENTKLFVGIVIGVVLSVAAFAWWTKNENQRLIAARNQLYEAKVLLEEERASIGKDETKQDESAEKSKKKSKDQPLAKAKEDSSLKMYEEVDIDKSYDQSLPKLKNVAEKYKGTRPGFEARFEIGNIFMNHGKADLAQSWYDGAADSAPGNYEKTLALVAAATSYENTKQYDEALKRVDKAVQLGVKPLRGEVLMAKARTLEELNKKEEAKKVYDQLIMEIPGTTHAKKAEVYRAQIQ